MDEPDCNRNLSSSNDSKIGNGVFLIDSISFETPGGGIGELESRKDFSRGEGEEIIFLNWTISVLEDFNL